MADSQPPEDERLAEGELSVDALSDSFAQLFGQASGASTPTAEPNESAGEEDQAAAADDDAQPKLRVVSASDTAEPHEQDAPDAIAVTPLNVLEAILFVGHPTNEPVTAHDVANMIRGVEESEVDGLVQQLNAHYDQEARPYEVVSVGSGYRMMLRPEYGALRDKFYGKVREARLTQGAIDILSVVAYEQPITRKQVESICQRSVASTLNQLVRRQLLSVERPDENPREPLYRTTDRFLSLFGMESLDELPRSQSIERDL